MSVATLRDTKPAGTSALPIADMFDGCRGVLPGAGKSWAGKPWADDLRQDGIALFRSLGVPGRKSEAWKYTDVNKLVALDYVPAPANRNSVSPVLQPELDVAAEHRLVFVNGHFRGDLSALGGLPDGATIASTADLLNAADPKLADYIGRLNDTADQPFFSLNTALMQDGFVLHLQKGVIVEDPIRIVFLTDSEDNSAVASHPRNLVLAEDNSQATLVEIHRGTDGAPYFTNAVTEISLGAGAHLHHYKLQDEGDAALHLANLQIRIGRDATYDNFILSLGARLARNDITAVLAAPGIDCRLSGAYVAGDRQHMDTTSFIDHAEPDCRSREVYAGVLDGRSRGVFQGKIIVRRDAQRTDGHQLNRALLLSDGAEIDSKPELEIYADDVKCSHGATAGEIDAEALFYLRTRGIGEKEARALLIEAFLLEALDEVSVPAVREEFAERLKSRLGDLGALS